MLLLMTDVVLMIVGITDHVSVRTILYNCCSLDREIRLNGPLVGLWICWLVKQFSACFIEITTMTSYNSCIALLCFIYIWMNNTQQQTHW